MNSRVVVITGASAGVGRAVAREFACEGAKIGLIARGIDGLEGAKRDIEAIGGQAIVLAADVADATAVEAAATKVEETFGPIDIWINNATATVFAPIKETTAEEFKRVTEVTYLGVVYGTMAALRRMLPRDRGVIVQVGSALAYRGIPLQAAYCGAKHAIQGFDDSLYSELLHDKSNVRLTMVNLPAINTPQFDWSRSKMPWRAQPVPPIFQPEVAARAIRWAADHHRRELNVAWPASKAIIGNNFFPGYGDSYLADHLDDQMTEEPEDPNRPHNLWQPLGGDRGAHGRFDDRALDHSIALDLNLNRSRIGPLVALAGSALMSALRKRNSSEARRRREEKAARISRELRQGNGACLRRRRGIVALSLVASASMGLIALYQTGLIKHLPEPPLPMMNADKVDASAEAYEKFSMPDAILGLGSYAATMGLAAMGGRRRVHETPWVSLALAVKIAIDVGNAAKLSVGQWTRHRAFCFWCLLAAGATFATAPLAASEAVAAMRVMLGKRALL
jgi:short-subunit dehydrogenase